MVLIGYSGHALVAAGILSKMKNPVTDYCDEQEKSFNPLQINYLGSEKNPEVAAKIGSKDFFIAIGNNTIRRNVTLYFEKQSKYPITIIHPTAIIDDNALISENGVMIAAGVCVNPFASIEHGVILNTGSIIEHECVIKQFSHIGPGAILCGNVKVGEGSFVGAGAVVRQNINIGNNVIIGAGAVVISDVNDDQIVVGNPSKKLVKNR